MKTLKWYLAVWLLFTGIQLKAQHTFDLIIGKDYQGHLVHTLETEQAYFSFGSRQPDSGEERLGLLAYKISKQGQILDSLNYYKQDTSFGVSFGYVLPNGNLFCAGTLDDSLAGTYFDVTYLCELTPNFELVWEKMYPIPNQTRFSRHNIKNFLITSDNNIIIQGKIDTVQVSNNDLLYLSKYDFEGNQLAFILYPEWKDSDNGSDLIYNQDSSRFYLFGSLTYSSMNLSKRWVEFDMDMTVRDHGVFEDLLSYCYPPLTPRLLSNGNIIMANKSSEINGNQQHDLEMRIMDQNYNMIKDTILYHDEGVNIPDLRGMGFVEENNIWVATYGMASIWLPGFSDFRFFIFDSELRLLGMKVYGGTTRYWFFDLLATSDGGCLLTGVIPKHETANKMNSYLIKVMPEDIITSAEETPFRHDQDVYIYPNPFKDAIHLNTIRKKLTFNLFDAMGQLLISETLTENQDNGLTANHLLSGMYFYQILNNKNEVIQNGKLIKH